MFKGKTILITGGTGSFGSNYAKYLLTNYDLKKLIIFSRDERKQVQLEQEIGDPRVRYFLGDVRDIARLQRAFNGVDIVIHAAALKQVPTLEYNPFEAVKTNILGSQNVVEAAIAQKVKKVLLVSTDKAAQPINLYGSTKLCAEKLFIDGNSYTPDGQTILSCVRYGNVFGSRGSVVPLFYQQAQKGEPLTVTDPNMTRFILTVDEAVKLILLALDSPMRGDVFIKRSPAARLGDIAQAFSSNIKVIGKMRGEKLHEALISSEEFTRMTEAENGYVIIGKDLIRSEYSKPYTSDLERLLSVSEIQQLAAKVLGVPQPTETLTMTTPQPMPKQE